MTVATNEPLPQQRYSLQHDRFVDLLADTENLLIIQDLDGVCMGLVKDPLHRTIDPDYVEATQAFEGHFYVLTNGEHVGRRGVNGILDRALGDRVKGAYLPGLAAGGVQWQDRDGDVAHPGVSPAELAFLKAVPPRIRTTLRQFAVEQSLDLDTATLEACIQASALDNIASPTANLNTFHGVLGGNRTSYVALQKTMDQLMETLLAEANQQGLGESFFVHYAPNHGRDAEGKEIPWFAAATESGTTDFQFMLRGAIKEAGVLVLLNRYYAQRTGTFPLGEGFNVRQAPPTPGELLVLVQDYFDPAQMPTLIGVGDTITSRVITVEGETTVQRGGSDRNFLQLVQAIGHTLGVDALVTYVDSSGGELKNRKPLGTASINGCATVVEGPGDPLDTHDPLTLNVVFPGGHRQYCDTFIAAAHRRQHRSP